MSSCGGGSPAAPSPHVRTLALLAYVPPLELRSRVHLCTGPISKHCHTGGLGPQHMKLGARNSPSVTGVRGGGGPGVGVGQGEAAFWYLPLSNYLPLNAMVYKIIITYSHGISCFGHGPGDGSSLPHVSTAEASLTVAAIQGSAGLVARPRPPLCGCWASSQPGGWFPRTRKQHPPVPLQAGFTLAGVSFLPLMKSVSSTAAGHSCHRPQC